MNNGHSTFQIIWNSNVQKHEELDKIIANLFIFGFMAFLFNILKSLYCPNETL